MILIPVHAGWNALHLACYIGNLEMVKWLIDFCALSPAIKDKDGSSPILLAKTRGYTEIVEFLVEYDGSLISSLNEWNGLYPLHQAARCDKLECAQVLLKHGADVLQLAEEGKVSKGYKGTTPLHLAIESESLQCIDELLNYEVDVNSVLPRMKRDKLYKYIKEAFNWYKTNTPRFNFILLCEHSELYKYLYFNR